jgi:steroid 5-alpha reductase family enzyme
MVIIVLCGWLVAALVMAAVWVAQRRRGNAGIVDVAWSFGTAGLGAAFCATAAGNPVRRALIAAMALTWGLRLGIHLWARVTRESEDGRYRELRRQWKGDVQRRLFLFFQLQALWAVLFALPMLAGAMNDAPVGLRDAVAVVLYTVAVIGETMADRQLAAFKRNPVNAGRVCDTGLWRYSRHPNYFFEWVHWWAYLALALGSPLWWIAAAGVVVMFLFLTRVTGIPPTEAQALRSRGEAYRAYQRRTPAFVPWRPAREHR